MRKYTLNKITKSYSTLLIVAIIFLQNPIWPLWKNSLGVLSGYFCVFLLFLLKYRKICFLELEKKKYFTILFISILILCHFFFLSSSFNYSTLFILLTYILCFFLDAEEQKDAFLILTKLISSIILISLPFWLFHSFITPLLIYNVIDISDFKGTTYILNNHIFFVTFSVFDHSRFYSMFDEPGVLGTLAAFILLGNRYNFKNWNNIVILLGGIFTYSMAFYILTLIGYFYYSIKSVKKFLYFIFILIILSFSVYYFLKDDLAFQQSVIGRLEDGNIFERFDNRTGFNADLFLENQFGGSDFFLGIGYDNMVKYGLKEGASYKLFLIQYGLIGLIILLLLYVSLMGKITLDTFIFLLLFFLSFAQRPYSFTSWQILLFSCVITILRNPEKYK